MSLWHLFFLLAFLCVGSLVCAQLTTIPLTGGAEEGEYILPLTVGTPVRSYRLRVDTGMPALYIPSFRCNNTSLPPAQRCHHVYHPGNSSTESTIPCTPPCLCVYPSGNKSECGFKETFRNGIVVDGTLVNDTINFFDNKSIPNVTFALFNSLPPSLIGSSANGLIGLSSWQTKFPNLNLLQQIAPTVGTSSFSLCLGEFGGQLVLGGYDPQYAGHNISYVPLVDKSQNTNFTVELTDFKISGRTVWESLWFSTAMTEKQCVSPNCTYATVDSGNQYLMLPEGAYQAVRSIFQTQLCPDHNTGPVGICGNTNFFTGECYILDDSTVKLYPTIELTLGAEAAVLTIPPSNYFIDYNGASCLALGSLPTGDSVILGNRIIQEYYTVFEPSNDRVGFTRAVNCSGAQYRAEAVSGNGQYGIVGKRLGKPFVVRVLRINDSQPVENITVTFNVVDSQPAAEVTWISQAIWRDSQGDIRPARVEPTSVVTGPDGLAQTYLWLEGAADLNTVTADIPLCLNHVIFNATGEPSFVWGMLVYFFLAALVTLVIILNVWYNKVVSKRKIERFNSVLNISTTKLFRSPSEDNMLSDPAASPPLSPSLSPPPGFPRDGLSNRNVNSGREYSDEDDDDEDPFQSAQPRTWYQNVRRKFKFEMWRFGKRVRNLVLNSDR